MQVSPYILPDRDRQEVTAADDFPLGGRESLFGALALRFLLQVTEAFNTSGNAAFRIFAALIVQVEGIRSHIIKPTLTRQILQHKLL